MISFNQGVAFWKLTERLKKKDLGVQQCKDLIREWFGLSDLQSENALCALLEEFPDIRIVKRGRVGYLSYYSDRGLKL